VGEARRPNQLDETQHREERVLAGKPQPFIR
jgi:hypothetical protein